jgi:Protein of unknown function (DUF3015)
MNYRREWLWMFLALVCQGVMLLNSPLSYAGNINVTIDGQSPPSSSQTNCADPSQCINIGGSYGVLTVVPVSVGAGRGAYARVDFPEPLIDDQRDALQIINARITNTGGVDKTFLVQFERENTTQPNSTKYYNTYLNGNFGAVASNSITSKSYFKVTGGTYAQVGSTLSHTVTCPSTCSTAFSKKTGAQRNPAGSLRWVKIELTIILKAGSYVDLNSGGQIITSGNAPDLSSSESVDEPCPGCVPKSNLSILCSTTYSTAKMFGCPSCITEDGQVAADSKIKLFASTNWDNLVQDMAKGRGEHLTSLAALLKIPVNRQSEFFELAQEKYRTPTGVEVPEQVIASLHEMWGSIRDR